MKVDLKVDEIRAAPTHFTKVHKYQEEIIKVEYQPGTKDFDEMLFRKQMLQSVKRQFPGKIVDADIMDGNPLLRQ